MLPDMMLVATGMAMAFKLRGEARCAITWFGDGSTSRGDFHEAMNWAGVQQLPVVFVLENNQYAYSTPLDQQFAVDPVERAAAYGFPGVTVDGNDAEAMFEATRGRARARARRRGPDAARGGDDAHARPRRARRHEVRARASRSRSGARRTPSTARRRGWPRSASTSTRCAPRSSGVDRRRRPRRRWPCRCPTRRPRPTACSTTATRTCCSATAPRLVRLRGAARRLMPTMTYLQAISDGLRKEMREDERVLVMGEDIGVFGGAFKVTDGFIEEFGAGRVMDTPLAESGIIGTAVGRGRRRPAARVRDAVRGLHLLRLRPARQRRGQDALPPGAAGEHHGAAALAAAASAAGRSTPRTPRRGSCTRPG